MTLRTILGLAAFLWTMGATAATAQPLPDSVRCDTQEDPPLGCAWNFIFASSDARDEDRLSDAEALVAKGLAIARRHSGEPEAPAALLEAIGTLASILELRGEVPAAEEQYRRAVTLAEEVKGRNSVEMLLALLKLSQNLGAQNRWAEAEKIGRSAVEIDRVTEYELKPVLSVTLQANLAATLGALGDNIQEERVVYEMAHAQYKKLSADFGVNTQDFDDLPALLAAHADSPKLAELRTTLRLAAGLLGLLGNNCRRQAEVERCIELLEESARVHTALLPEWRHALATDKADLSRLYRDAGRTRDALASINEAMTGYYIWFGRLHPTTSTAEAYLGSMLLYQSGEPNEALVHFRRSTIGISTTIADPSSSGKNHDRIMENRHVFRDLVVAAWHAAHTTRPPGQ